MLFNPSTAQEEEEKDLSTFPLTSMLHPATVAKEAATVNTTPNSLVRKAEVTGKCQSVVSRKASKIEFLADTG